MRLSYKEFMIMNIVGIPSSNFNVLTFSKALNFSMDSTLMCVGMLQQ